MSKFNKPTVHSAKGTAPMKTEATPSMTTYEGGPGYQREAKAELFMLAVSNMVSEDTFYEKGSHRDERYRALVWQCALEDFPWTVRLLVWLRKEANLRSASMVGALEAVKARIDAGHYTVTEFDASVSQQLGISEASNRALVNHVLQRADEPGEALAYWMSRYGRRVPLPVKNGVADAVKRLYTEYSLLKYDTTSHAFRFGDVIDLVHPRPSWTDRSMLYKYALDRRHGREDISYMDSLPMIQANHIMRHFGGVNAFLDPAACKAAGMTWEDVLSAVGSKAPKAKVWEAIIPSMGYMALLRNLRNFDEAGIPDVIAAGIANVLSNKDAVAKSRQLPYRFWSAYKSVNTFRWHQALEIALNHSVHNIPTLPGKTLVLVDTSGSMSWTKISEKSDMSLVQAAALFGCATAKRCGASNVDLYGFASGTFYHRTPESVALLHLMNKFAARVGEVGHGTDMYAAVQHTYKNHDRVFIFTDMQTVDGGYSKNPAHVVPAHVPVYGFNLGGYKTTAMPTGQNGRYEFGGLTDATFKLIPLLESGRNGDWPF